MRRSWQAECAAIEDFPGAAAIALAPVREQPREALCSDARVQRKPYAARSRPRTLPSAQSRLSGRLGPGDRFAHPAASSGAIGLATMQKLVVQVLGTLSVWSRALSRARARWERTRTTFGESPSMGAISRGVSPSQEASSMISRSIAASRASAAGTGSSAGPTRAAGGGSSTPSRRSSCASVIDSERACERRF